MYECVECGHIWCQDIGLGELEPRQCPNCEFYSVRAYVPSNVVKPLLCDVLAELEKEACGVQVSHIQISKDDLRRVLSKYFA